MTWACKYLHWFLGDWFQESRDAHGFPQRRECLRCGRLWFRGPWRGDRWECRGRAEGKWPWTL